MDCFHSDYGISPVHYIFGVHTVCSNVFNFLNLELYLTHILFALTYVVIQDVYCRSLEGLYPLYAFFPIASRPSYTLVHYINGISISIPSDDLVHWFSAYTTHHSHYLCTGFASRLFPVWIHITTSIILCADLVIKGAVHSEKLPEINADLFWHLIFLQG